MGPLDLAAGTVAFAPRFFRIHRRRTRDLLTGLLENRPGGRGTGRRQPTRLLRAATLGAAEYLGATDSLGAVAEGKLADLVLLDGDPLREIGNVRRVHAVVADGRLLVRRDLDELLGRARASAGRD